jgi:hypothetical protein
MHQYCVSIHQYSDFSTTTAGQHKPAGVTAAHNCDLIDGIFRWSSGPPSTHPTPTPPPGRPRRKRWRGRARLTARFSNWSTWFVPVVLSLIRLQGQIFQRIMALSIQQGSGSSGQRCCPTTEKPTMRSYQGSGVCTDRAGRRRCHLPRPLPVLTLFRAGRSALKLMRR